MNQKLKKLETSNQWKMLSETFRREAIGVVQSSASVSEKRKQLCTLVEKWHGEAHTKDAVAYVGRVQGVHAISMHLCGLADRGM